MSRTPGGAEIRLPSHEEAISAVTIFDGQGQKDVMRSLTILKSWLFVFPLAVTLTGCAWLDAKTGAGGAAPGSLELKVGYGSERPVEVRVPAPDVNAGVSQIKEENDANTAS